MNVKIFESLTNPVKCKLILAIHAKEKVTAKQLSEACPDIPQTSLYRHLKSMTDDGVLHVVEERPVRGTVEKVYAVVSDFSLDIQRIIEENDGQAYLLLFTQYMMGVLNEFREYTARPNIDILEDGTAFSLAPVYITKEEWMDAAQQIGSIIAGLMKHEKTPERRLHNIGVILTPPSMAEQTPKEGPT